jgi:toxin ParE1/3/4
MSSRILWSPPAERDRDAIAEYISRNSPKSAVRFLDAVEQACQRLADMPEIGGVWESSLPRLVGLRVWQIPGFENYLLFYRVAEPALQIVRLLHGARDLERQLRN